MNEQEAREELRPIIDALREWNNKYNFPGEDGVLHISACIIDTPETGEKYFNIFNSTKCSPFFDFVFRD